MKIFSAVFTMTRGAARLLRVGVVSLVLFARLAGAETFANTNPPGAWTDFAFTVGGGVSSVSLTVANTPSAYSHLLLRAGEAPSLADYDFAAKQDGVNNAIHLELPELLETNYVARVYTPASSAAHAFALTVELDPAELRSSAKPVMKRAASVTQGNLNPGEWHYFEVEVGAGLPGWIINLNSEQAVDLYVRRGALPTTATADRLSVSRPVDTLYFSGAEATPGIYYVGVRVPDTAGQAADYTLQTAPGALTTLDWDPGSTHDGTQVVTNDTGTAGDFYFKITTQSSAVGVWRTALAVADGGASVYLSRGLLPGSWVHQFASTNSGSDGFVLHSSQFQTGEEWFLLVKAEAGARWRLCSGDVFVQQLGALAADDSSGSGAVPIGPEGMRFFKTTVPVNTLAWRLGLGGPSNPVLVKKNSAPHPRTEWNWRAYDLQQAGQMLVVPDYLVPGNDVYFVAVVGAPGTVLTLDSRQHEVTELAFSATTSLTVPGAGYATYRIQVPVQQVGWQVNVTPSSGNPNLAVRRNLVPNEWRNDALSEAVGGVADSIALGPPVLSDGTFYLTVYGVGSFACTVTSGDAQVTDINYVDVRVNDEPNRVGWKFYRVANLQQQSGTLGWDILLSNQPPGTEIAVRRNAIPYRRNFRTDESGYLQEQGTVDASSLDGFLQRPAHQADVWYIGIYHPTIELGAFTLTTRELVPENLALNGGTSLRTDVAADLWQFFRVDVPAGTIGWEVRLSSIVSGQPRLVVRRGQLPVSLESRTAEGSGWHFPYASRNWPIGFQWAPDWDWTSLPYSPEGASESGRILAVGMGNPLEPGTYYVGIRSADDATPLTYSIQSRAIGEGQALPLTDLGYAGGSAANPDLPAREAVYYRVMVPTNVASWQVRLEVTAGEALLLIQKDAVPCIQRYWDSVFNFSGGFNMQQAGNEHFLLLPEDGQTNIAAGTYYLAVASEGEGPAPGQGRIGTGGCSYVLTSIGSIPVTDLGATGGTDLVVTNTQEGGELKAYQFNAPAGTAAVELRLADRVGNPLMAVVPGAIWPRVAGLQWSSFDGYGSEAGHTPNRREGAELVTVANPSGVLSLLVKANTLGGVIPEASYTLRVRALNTEPLAFDNGASTVTEHAAGAWRYFAVEVPTNALGWDLRLVNVANCSPQIVVRRGLLPDEVFTSSGSSWPTWYYDSNQATNWPAGYQMAAGPDWTQRNLPAEGETDERGRVLTLSMGNPLEPGTYSVGVFNASEGPEAPAYTLVSRGIGGGLALPVTPLGYEGGTVTESGLTPREVAYYRVTVPPEASSWQIKLTALAGEAMMVVQHNGLPNLHAPTSGMLDLPPSDGGRRIQKEGNEHLVLLAADGQLTLLPGDYYIAVVSEGVAPAYNRIGSGSSDFTLTSIGALPIENLGVMSSDPAVRSVTLEAGETRAYHFTVPQGASSVEIRLSDRLGNPYLVACPGAGLPYRQWYDPPTRLNYYGVVGGHIAGRLEDAELITLANPLPGLYSLIVKGQSVDYLENQFEDASATLSVRTSGTVELGFDGGSVTVANQGPGAWSFFRVAVPADAVGWDIRLTEAIGGRPRLVVRRDTLPESTDATGWDFATPFSFTNWPSGNQLTKDQDWTRRQYSADSNVDEQWRMLALGMGNPLEPGVYYVGVYNDDPATPTGFRIVSRGIGDGMSLPVMDLPFQGGSVTGQGLVAREAAYYRVIVPEGATSWKVKLTATAGEGLLAVQQQTPPSSAVERGAIDNLTYPPRNGWSPGGRLMQKAGNEHFVLLPEEGQSLIPPGAYYLVVVSEGVNPADDWHIGMGSSDYVLQSLGEVPVLALGDTDAGPLTHVHTLEGGELAIYAFTVPAGTPALETRLVDRQGNPVLALRAGEQVGYHFSYWGLQLLGHYGVYDGYYSELLSDSVVITIPNPAPGAYRLAVKARSTDDERTFPDAAYTLQVRAVPVPELNFTSQFNTNGGSHSASALLADNQRAFYRVDVPATVWGQPVQGWKLDLFQTQGRASVRVRKDELPADAAPRTTSFSQSAAVIVPPYLEPGTWFVEIKGEGVTEFTLNSSVLVLERPAWAMPQPGQPVVTPGLTAPEFADSGMDASGQPLPGDQGIYLEDGKYHFYAITVPANNGALIQVTLENISGDPNLYARAGLPPTLTHDANGGTWGYLVEQEMTGTGTDYGSWVPASRTSTGALTPGTWYLAVRAGGNSNARYRLRLSTGNVQTLTLDGGSYSGQILAAGEWRYYRVDLPFDAPANWHVSFSQQSGEVELFVRDTVPPGSHGYLDYQVPARDWQYDYKNQGPYPQALAQGAHTFTLPPLRPGHAYYLGFRARSDAGFSVNSSTSGTAPAAGLVSFYGGNINTTLPAAAAVLYRIDVPHDAVRWRHTSSHSAAVQLYLEQGTVPQPERHHWRSYWEDSSLNRSLANPNDWPWVINQSYFLLVTNTTDTLQSFSLTMDGRTLLTEDEDEDSLPDAWEAQYFGNYWDQHGNGDADGDGLSNAQEHQLGTDPTNALTRGQLIMLPPLTGGRLQLHFTGEIGQRYLIESTTNLSQWEPVRQFTNLTGTVLFEDTTTNQARQFYRSALVP